VLISIVFSNVSIGCCRTYVNSHPIATFTVTEEQNDLQVKRATWPMQFSRASARARSRSVVSCYQ